MAQNFVLCWLSSWHWESKQNSREVGLNWRSVQSFTSFGFSLKLANHLRKVALVLKHTNATKLSLVKSVNQKKMHQKINCGTENMNIPLINNYLAPRNLGSTSVVSFRRNLNLTQILPAYATRSLSLERNVVSNELFERSFPLSKLTFGHRFAFTFRFSKRSGRRKQWNSKKGPESGRQIWYPTWIRFAILLNLKKSRWIGCVIECKDSTLWSLSNSFVLLLSSFVFCIFF